jgi:SNF2 family DNA or RNA helicase
MILHDKMSEITIKTVLKPHQEQGKKQLETILKRNKGAFLCDEPGLGKTLTAISLIKRDEKVFVVGPSHLLEMWKSELTKHTSIKSSEIYIFHGRSRSMESVNAHRIVITSFQVLVSEYKNERFTLFNKQWDRLILDEYHFIVNPKALSSQVVQKLKYKKVLLLTGTPIMNKLADIHVGFKIMGIPVPQDTTVLINVFNSIMIRRTKDILLESQKTTETRKLECTDYEKEFYIKVLRYFTHELQMIEQMEQLVTLSAYEKAKLRGSKLVLILRLRQLCSSPLLLLNMINSDQTNSSAMMKKMTNFLKRRIQELNTQTEVEDCPICFEEPNVLLGCGHSMCEECLDILEKKSVHDCPICRKSIQKTIKKTKNEYKLDTNNNTLQLCTEESSKLNALKEIIKNNKNGKLIFVSQWKGMLKIVSTLFKDETYIQIDGDSSTQERFEKCNNYNKDASIKYCLISTCCSVEGLSLISCDRMIFLDPWWNNAKMAQIEDRIHRIGQTKNVKIEHLIMENTIETKLCELIDKKKTIHDVLVGKKKYEEHKTLLSKVINLLNE